MKAYRNPAIIIGGGSTNGLGIARNLSSCGIPVVCVTSDPQELTLVSRFCGGSTLLPGVDSDPSILATFLRHFQQRIQGTGVVFPTSDTALLTVAALGKLDPPYIAPIPDRRVVEMMVLKDRFYQSLKQHGIPHPRTLPPEALDAAFETQVAYPVFIRPAQSLLFHERIGGKGFVAENSRELRYYLQVAERAGLQVMVQEIIPGPPTAGFTMWGYLDQQTRLNVLIVTQKVRKPRMFANASVERSVPRILIRDVEPSLLAYFQALPYYGLFGIEFKRDARDGSWKVLEVNARSLGGNEMALACGVNHVLAAYQEALGVPMAPQLDYLTGVYLIDTLVDLPTLLLRLVRGQGGLHDLVPYTHRKHWLLLSRRDPLPWVSSLRTAIPRLPRAFHP